LLLLKVPGEVLERLFSPPANYAIILGAMTSRRVLLILLVLALPSWAGLAYVTLYADPEVAANRFLFLAFLLLSLAFSLTPLFHLLEYRLAKSESHQGDILRSARRGGLLALFFVLCAWMKIGQALNWTNAFLLVAALVLAEIFMLVRGA